MSMPPVRDPAVQYTLPELPEASPTARAAVDSEADLVRLAVQLGAPTVGGPLSQAESALVARSGAGGPGLPESALATIRLAIAAGQDPLGEALYSLRSAAFRRELGAVYTPPELVRPMVDWTLHEQPDRVIDAGAGSGRFTVELLRRSAVTSVIAIDTDPVATLMTRAAISALGAAQAAVLHADYTTVELPPFSGQTAFLGNPPYVRHHNLSPRMKAWAQVAAKIVGRPVSGLAGIHAYFFLATALHGKAGDIGCFVTSSEWLDVNYGSIIRDLLLGKLGGQSLCVLEPTALPFVEAATTAAITCFRVGDSPRSIRLRAVKNIQEVAPVGTGQPIAVERLAESSRWSPFVRTSQKPPEGYIELGELCRVHRGAVTGLNAVWVSRSSVGELPDRVLFPSITKAKELFQAGDALTSVLGLRQVIDIPPDLDLFDSEERRQIELFLQAARRAGAADGYIARNRRAWWSVGLRAPAPILATYMARRPPAFVRNIVEARHINVAHGLYPRQPLAQQALDSLAAALRSSITVAQGRTYAGGLTKFEPREMERLPVPDLPALLGG